MSCRVGSLGVVGVTRMSGMVGSGRGLEVVLGSPGSDTRSKGFIVPLQCHFGAEVG